MTEQGNTKDGATAMLVPIENIDADETNVRSRLQGIDELAASIRAVGIIQPLVGAHDATGRIKLIAGHRRLAAAKAAGLEAVPLIVREVESDVAKELQLTENVQREDLPALDVAEALQAMVSSGQTAESIAARLGKSSAWVRRHLALLKLDGKVLSALRKHGLRFTQAEHVAKVLKTGSLNDALEAANGLASGLLSRRSAERALANDKAVDSHRQAFNGSGARYRASLNIESELPIDSVRAKQLGDLMLAIDRIMTWTA